MESSKPQIKIKGKIQDMDKKEKNEKPKNSNFLLTINTNQSYKDNDEHLTNDIKVFDKTIIEILQNVDKYVNLPDGDTWNDDKIKNCNIDYTIERGTQKHHLHIHILFKFTHFTKIQLNYEKIKHKIISDLGLSNVYLYNRLVRNNGSDNILSYLNKYT